MDAVHRWKFLLDGCDLTDVHVTLSYILNTMTHSLDPDKSCQKNHALCDALTCFCKDPCESTAIELLNSYPGFKRVFALANPRNAGNVGVDLDELDA